MVNPNDPNFNPGGIKSPEDPRDFQYSEVGFASAPFDWNKGYDIEQVLGVKIPTEDQGDSGSCGGQAWKTLNEVQEALATGTFERRSAKYIYAQTAVTGGGSAGRSNCDICVKQGISLEMLCPSYLNGNPPTEAFIANKGDITAQARQNASTSVDKAYASLNIDISSIAQAVRDNGGAVIGLTGSNNGTWLSVYPLPPKQGQSFWYHFMYVGKAKLINGKKYIGCKQHWGAGVGEDGWQWLSEDYFTAVINSSHGYYPIWEAWTMTFNVVPTVFHHTFNKDLTYGMENLEVTALQTALQIDGEFSKGLIPTKYFGKITEAAVKVFQLKYNLTVPDENEGWGRVGPKTRAKLNSLFA